MAEAWNAVRVKNFIISLLRAGSRKWPPRAAVLNAAKTEKKINVKTGRLAQHYACCQCKKEVPLTGIQIDHKEAIVDPTVGFVDWNTYIDRMFVSEEKLQPLCRECHSAKSKEENKERRKNK